MALILTDFSNNGNALTNNAGITESVSLPFAASNISAADLEAGSNQYFSAADSGSLSFTSDFSLELWVNHESLPTDGNFMGYISRWQVATNKTFSFKIKNTAGTYSLQLEVSNDGGATEVLSKDITTPNTGTYYHHAVTWTAATSTAEFYVDGSSQGTSTGAMTALFDTTIGMRIGVEETTGFFDGLMDDIRVWNDKRTTTEINNNKALRLVGNEANLVAYFPLDDPAAVAGRNTAFFM